MYYFCIKPLHGFVSILHLRTSVSNNLDPDQAKHSVSRAVVGFLKVVRPLNAVDVTECRRHEWGESKRGGMFPSR